MSFTLEIGKKAPAFELPGVDGKSYSLGSFQGSPLLVISFTCNHCPYVVGNEAREKAFVERYRGKGVAYLGINSNETANHPTDDFENMKKRAAALGFTWPYLRDEKQDAAKAYGAIKTPHFFLFDRDRVLRYVGRIWVIEVAHDPPRMDNSPRNVALANTHELADAVDDLLAGRDVRVPVTEAIGCTVKWWGKDHHFIPNDVCDLV